MGEPFDHGTARKYVRAILGGVGTTAFTKHAREEMAKDRMTSVDVENVLRGGRVSGNDLKNGCWRYRSETQRMTVVFLFRGHEHDPKHAVPNELVVVTAWRNES